MQTRGQRKHSCYLFYVRRSLSTAITCSSYVSLETSLDIRPNFEGSCVCLGADSSPAGGPVLHHCGTPESPHGLARADRCCNDTWWFTWPDLNAREKVVVSFFLCSCSGCYSLPTRLTRFVYLESESGLPVMHPRSYGKLFCMVCCHVSFFVSGNRCPCPCTALHFCT